MSSILLDLHLQHKFFRGLREIGCMLSFRALFGSYSSFRVTIGVSKSHRLRLNFSVLVVFLERLERRPVCRGSIVVLRYLASRLPL